MVLRTTKPIPKPQRRWVDVTLAGARFQNADLTGARFNGVIVADVEIDGLLLGLKVNGVDVVPLVQAELDRRHPELPQIRSDDPDELREGWATIRRTWAQTMARADALPAEQVRVEVADEWSFADTLRHLIFATDAWISRPILGDPQPYWPGGLGATDMPPWFTAAAQLQDATPSYADIVAARAQRVSTLTEVIESLTGDELARRCTKNRAPGYPADTRRFTVQQCIHTTLSEEWAHHSFAVRDLERLSQG